MIPTYQNSLIPVISMVFAVAASWTFHETQGIQAIPKFSWDSLVSFDTTGCNQALIRINGKTVNQTENLLTAFGDANIIAHAGILAAAKPNEPPFNYFFHPTDNETVVQGLQMVTGLTENTRSFRSAHIVMTCNNPQWCKLQNQWGYSQVWNPTHVFWE